MDAAAAEGKTNGIGASIPRRELPRLMSGDGRYIDDIKLPRMLHLCFVRSAHPHAQIKSIDTARAAAAPGIEAVLTAAELNPMCKPLIGVALHRPGHRSPPQGLLAEGRAVWQGQPVVAVVAASRAEAEDAAALVEIEWEPLPAVSEPLAALDGGMPVVHPELGNNVAFDFTINKGDPDDAFAEGPDRRRGRISLRAPTGVDARDARLDRRFQSQRRHADRHSQSPVAVPDAGRISAGISRFPNTKCGSSRRISAAASA